MKRRRKDKRQPWQFLCKTCGEISTAPPNGTLENEIWRHAWVLADLIACRDCLGVFYHETMTIIFCEIIEESG